MTYPRARPPTWPQFMTWALCGGCSALVLLGAFTVGPLAILPGALLVLLAVRLGGTNASVIGLLAGIAPWAFLLAWLNRGGPGEVCLRTAHEVRCDTEWSPWPFVGVAVAALVVSVVVFLRARNAQSAGSSPVTDFSRP